MPLWTSKRQGDFALISSNTSSPWHDGGTQAARVSVTVSGDTFAIDHRLTWSPVANEPLIYSRSRGDTNPFGTKVTAWYLTCTPSARLQAMLLTT